MNDPHSTDPRIADLDPELQDLGSELITMLARRSEDIEHTPRALPEVSLPELPRTADHNVHEIPLMDDAQQSVPDASNQLWRVLVAAAVIIVVGFGAATLWSTDSDGVTTTPSVDTPADIEKDAVDVINEEESLEERPDLAEPESPEERPDLAEPESPEFTADADLSGDAPADSDRDVITSADEEVIQAASEALETLPNGLVGTIATVNNRTGELVMSVTTFAEGMDTAQPVGSTQDLYTLLTAVEQGFQPNDFIDGTGPCTLAGESEPLRNFGGSSGSVQVLEYQAQIASRCAFARLEQAVGSGSVTATMSRLTGTTVADTAAPFWGQQTLLTPIDQATAMARIVSDAAAGDPSAAGVLAVYRRNVVNGTGMRANIGSGVAGATGTNEQFGAAWFVGTRGDLSTAVLVIDVDDDDDELNFRLTGGSHPAEVWAAMYGGDASLRDAEPTADRRDWTVSTPRPAQLIGDGEMPAEAIGLSSTDPKSGCPASYPVEVDIDEDGVVDRCYQEDAALPEGGG